MIGLGALPTADPLTQAQGMKALPGPAEKTDKAARQFEGLLMGLLFQTMRKTVEPSGLLGDSGQSRSTYEYLMDQAVVDQAVSTGHGWGLADRLKESWNQHEKTDKKITTPDELRDSGKLPIGALSR
ncbi:rod-binding protein [Geothrix sp.]|uniref:rod-binding protein n=1 Tax=Geothrix sp. TaxID=1962974 RepID=UPI0025C39F98|nr:rod-binding protein [Geothrix sp.]